ncbi:MAG: ASKHA domain-containing protein [Treponema sp.]|nr:ASKHA domain-containing protein [Treponema sp.]
MGKFAVGLDIGTTTILARLVDLDSGKSIDEYSALNNQRCFGADVMTRISAALNGKLDELFSAVNNQTEEILLHFIKKHNLSAISKCVVSGNTCMLHLFCRADPASMGTFPYKPLFLEERNFKGCELSLSVEHVTLLPGISSFIGADITAGLALIDIINKGEDALFIDIGTNGEIAVWKNSEKSLLCCSTAAGPCFEESEISCGLNAADFINAIAEMKRGSIINETGALADEFTLTGFPAARDKIITQKDIRQFQLAKSAIYSGIKTLCKTASMKLDGYCSVYIAGGLGFYLDLGNAVFTGLLPREFAGDLLRKKTTICGNTSLNGAVNSLIDPDFKHRCHEIISRAETIDLTNNKYFTASFEHNMYFRV